MKSKHLEAFPDSDCVPRKSPVRCLFCGRIQKRTAKPRRKASESRPDFLKRIGQYEAAKLWRLKGGW